MKRPLAYIKASWGVDPTKNTEIAAKYSTALSSYSLVSLVNMSYSFKYTLSDPTVL